MAKGTGGRGGGGITKLTTTTKVIMPDKGKVPAGYTPKDMVKNAPKPTPSIADVVRKSK